MRFAPFLPAAALLAIWVAWIPADGGYFPRDWFPAALFVVALLAAVAIAGRRALPAGRWARVALALLAAATAWSFLSMLWAEADGRAWQSSDQLLLYLAMAWLVALVPWRPASALGFMGLWSVAVAVVCGVELISALSASDLGHYVLESRWQQPTGYANAAAAIAAMGAWPALVISARRGVPAALQVAMALVAVFLLEMSVLPQSRGALIASAIVLPLLLALSPDRGRLLVRLVVVALAFAVAGDAVWDVYGDGEAGRPLAPALDRAAEAMLLSLGVVALAAAAAVILERTVTAPSLPAPPRGARWGALAAVLAVAAVAGLVNAGSISDYADDRWEEFKSEEELPDENASRIAQRTSDKRYDYWRVSLNALADAPAGGIGAGGFEREYTEHRRHPKPSQAAHSIWFRALSETGVIGAALLALLVGALAAGVLAARRAGETGRAAATAAAGVAGYFLVHVSLDWLELFPALAAPALGFALAATVAGARPPGSTTRARRLLGAAAVVIAALAAIASLALPYLSIRHVDSALARAADQRDDAERELDRAADLDPLAPEPHLARGTLALRRADFAGAERAFRRALEVEDGWYPHFELALLASRAGRKEAAKREIEQALRLNPPDPLVLEAAELIEKRKRIDPRGVDRHNVEIRLYNDPRGH